MSKHTITIKSIDDLPEAAAKFISLMNDNTVFAFYGSMGAGKTTFINELCRQLGVEDDATGSPSFSLINEYRSNTTAELIYHFDLYRLDSMEEAFDIGVEDIIDCGALCFIEWPDKIADILPDDSVRVDILLNDDNTRQLIINLPE